MPKKNVAVDRREAKEKKQKRLAYVLGAVLVLVLVYEVPHTMKLMNKKAQAPIVNTSSAAPAAVNPSAGASSSPSTPAASLPPSVSPAAPAASQSIVASVQVTPDPGQLTEFERFATKDPFAQSVQQLPGTSGTTPSTKKKTPSSPSGTPQPPAPPPTSAVISLNGELMLVAVGSDFPTAGTVFSQTGSPLFHLVSATGKTAKISIAGGSYADGSPAVTLRVGTPVTLQNTADGSRYTLLLEPQGTPVPTPTSTTPTSTTPTTTTSTPSVVPSAGG